ncbi:MAG: hypothetical protein PF503_12360 [Desulfobacula sp.]|jgi:hypothetical protein|nr:hypothetical protein [Desulfobacula sp.]
MANDNIPLINKDVRRMQRLRLQRFAMALATYTLVILATFLTTRLGLGEMNGAQWVTYIGLALFGNGIFLVLFYTNANLRFSDPSLTREQIVYSSLWGMVVLYFLPEARPIVLMFYLPAFSFGILRLTLRQYFGVEACVLLFYAALLGLEYFQYSQGFNIQYQLFLFILFGILLTWFAFFGGFVTDLKRRLRLRKEEIKIEMEERKIAQIEKEKLIVELKNALREVKTLSGLLPICASCKKIRDDQGYWNQIESYIQIRSNAEFSHSICPDCAKKLYPDIDIYNEDE